MKRFPAVLLALLLVLVLSSFVLTAPSDAQKQKQRVHAAAGSHSVVLSWTQSPAPSCTPACPITGNNLYRSTTSGTEGTTPYQSFPTPTVTFTDVAVTSGNTYFYKVTAVNSAGESAQSSEVSAAIPNPIAPNAPTGLTATPQ